MSADLPILDAGEARVLGVLAEKEAVTPDAYPMTLNAIVAGCNQLTSRDPVMQLDAAAIEAALATLGEKKLVSIVHQAGARVTKYEHRMRIVHAIERPHAVLLALLLLRGPQTAGELRQRGERLHAFADVPAVEQALQFLADKFPPLVARLARAPGMKEPRYAQLLCGEVASAPAAAPGFDAPPGAASSAGGDFAGRMSAMESEIAALKTELAALKRRLDD